MSATSENRKLCDLVRELATKMDRPICSKDLHAHFEVYPESRPSLTQRYGQVLLKAGRPFRNYGPRIHQVGIHDNRAYYAPDPKQIWETRFTEFRNGEKLLLFHRLRYYEQVRYLLGGPHDALARHSLAGWIVEADLLISRCPAHPVSSILAQQREHIRLLAAPSFTRVVPTDLLPRPAGLSQLQRFNQEHAAHRSGFRVNYNRYLAELKWPQSHIYAPLRGLNYSARQLQAFIVSKWPLAGQNEEEAFALLWALRYPPVIRG